MVMDFTLNTFSSLVEVALAGLSYPTVAPGLFAPVRYTLESGGKRLRPVLVLASYSALSKAEPSTAINQALAIEMFHNFTLLHDDVMDRADIRRGRPTVHRKWGENVAILSGDAMLTMASQLLAKGAGDRLAELSECFNKTAMEVYEGQQLDMEFEDRDDVSIKEYLFMIGLKTSVLLGCACRLGAIMAGADSASSDAMYNYGFALGMAFQLRDDWLDTFGDPAIFGKEIGGDIVNHKKTWLLISALEAEPEELPAILAEDLEPQETIEQVKTLYERHSLGDRCQELALRYSAEAKGYLDKVDMDVEARAFFAYLADQASARKH